MSLSSRLSNPLIFMDAGRITAEVAESMSRPPLVSGSARR